MEVKIFVALIIFGEKIVQHFFTIGYSLFTEIPMVNKVYAISI